MSIELVAEDGAIIRTSNGWWCFYLELAHYHYGWIPEGTKKPKGFGLFKSWKGRFEDGGYTSSDGQLVSSSDARSLANALERALSDALVHEKGSIVATSMNDEVKAEFGGTVPEHVQHLLVSGEIDRTFVQNLVVFCRKGGFRIE